MNVEQYVQEIKNQLRKKGYSGKKVDYAELQQLHQEYGSQLQEKVFALYVLELGINNYNGLKNGKYKTAILQEQLTEIIKQEAEKIRNELLLRGYAGRLIDYTEIQRLHQIYGAQMPEATFVKSILEVSENSYVAAKAGKRKVYILRDLQNESLEEIEEIKKRIREDGYVGKIIDYQKLQNLHKIYGIKFSESRFAQKVLEINEGSYLSSKNHGTKMTILKGFIGQIAEDEIENIKETLRRDGYVGKSVDYIELKRLHLTYGKQMLEREFAQKVLGLTYSYYINIRNDSKKRAVILKSLLSPKVSSEEVKDIKEKLKEQGYNEKKIDYERTTKATSNVW